MGCPWGAVNLRPSSSFHSRQFPGKDEPRAISSQHSQQLRCACLGSDGESGRCITAATIPRVLGGILRATQGRASGLHLPGKILRPSWGRCLALWALKLSEQQRPDLGGRAMSCRGSCLLCFCWTFRALLLLDPSGQPLLHPLPGEAVASDAFPHCLLSFPS